jgi:hypothetical protein
MAATNSSNKSKSDVPVCGWRPAVPFAARESFMAWNRVASAMAAEAPP